MDHVVYVDAKEGELALLLDGKQLNLGLSNLYLLAAIPTLLVAWKTRSMFGAVITGMALVAAGRLLFHM